MVNAVADKSSVPPVGALYQLTIEPEGGVAERFATVAFPQKLWTEAVGVAGKVFIVTAIDVRVLLTQPVAAVLASA